MDGVLFDSMPGHARSWHESMARFGVNMTPEDAYAFEGMRGVETIKTLCRRQWGREISDDEAERMYAAKCEIFAQQPEAGKMAGVEQFMRMVRASGKKIGVVTGSGQATLLDKLEHEFRGLVKRSRMVTSFDVEHGKPAPDPYIMGLRKCGVIAREAIVVENAPLGVKSAKAAGCFTIAVNTGPLADEILADAGADVVLGSMEELCCWWEEKVLSRPGPEAVRDKAWDDHYAEIEQFIMTNKRRPSKHYASDSKMHNWLKYNKKMLNKGKMPAYRVERFNKLLALIAHYRRLNLSTYADARLNIYLSSSQ